MSAADAIHQAGEQIRAAALTVDDGSIATTGAEPVDETREHVVAVGHDGEGKWSMRGAVTSKGSVTATANRSDQSFGVAPNFSINTSFRTSLISSAGIALRWISPRVGLAAWEPPMVIV